MLDIFIEILQYSGLIGAILVPILFTICWRRNKNYKFSKQTLCSCGGTKESGKLFVFSLTLFGIFQGLFVIGILYKFSLFDNLWVSVLPVTASLFTFLAGLISVKVNRIAHDVLGYCVFALLIVWSLILPWSLIGINYLVGLISLIISIVLVVGTGILFFIYGGCAIPEIFFLGIVIVWNLFFSYVVNFL